MARFARRARMQKPGEFQAAFERGRRFNENLLAAVVTANDLNHPRLGLAVAKKNIPTAVARNRIKRHIRESFRFNQQRLPAADIVILPRAACLKATAPELRENLNRLWTRILEQ